MMTLQLDQVMPHPLRDSRRASGIWGQSLHLEPGQQVFIQAPSGTGKSTLIHILYGLRRDYDGLVRWDGKDIRVLDEQHIARQRSESLSIIFQDLRLFPELTARENLEIKRSLTDTVPAVVVDEWMERLGLAHRRNALAATLSYGERQRVAIIRALLQPFRWLLMDEPFSHLDHENIEKAVDLIREVVVKNNSSLLLADLEDNNYFSFTQKIKL